MWRESLLYVRCVAGVCARQLEYAMERAGGALQALGGSVQEGLGSGVHLAEGAHLGGAHLGVDAHPLVTGEAAGLLLAGGEHPLAHHRRGFDLALAGELLVLDARDLDVDVDALQCMVNESCPLPHEMLSACYLTACRGARASNNRGLHQAFVQQRRYTV